MKNDALKIRGPIADGTSGEKQGLANVFNIQNLSNSTKTVRKQEGWREQTQSIFASAEVGYKGTYYLTLTGRNDWPSQLAGPHSNAKSFFYPSVGLSVVLSQLIPNMPENLSYIKLRGSFASVGVAFERYIANPLYSWNESGLSWNTQTQYPAYHLKPERTKSFEVGLTMRFLKHFNLDFTYYNSHTSNQTFDPQISGGNSIPQFYTYSATNVRLQEASIGYTIPREVLRNVCEITVSIVGRNLWMLYNKAPFDPESIATTGNYYQGIDYFMMPSLRNVGFNLRFKF